MKLVERRLKVVPDRRQDRKLLKGPDGPRAKRQIWVPNNAPIPAVMPIAKAPQKVTRSAALPIVAPPTQAPTAPSIARNNSEAIETLAMTHPLGVTSARMTGNTAPTAKADADAKAA
jgi:hypothetical protein